MKQEKINKKCVDVKFDVIHRKYTLEEACSRNNIAVGLYKQTMTNIKKNPARLEEFIHSVQKKLDREKYKMQSMIARGEGGGSIVSKVVDNEMFTIEEKQRMEIKNEDSINWQAFKIWRANKQLTQTQIAEKIGCSPSLLGKFEHNKSGLSSEVTYKIIKAFNTTVAEINEFAGIKHEVELSSVIENAKKDLEAPDIEFETNAETKAKIEELTNAAAQLKDKVDKLESMLTECDKENTKLKSQVNDLTNQNNQIREQYRIAKNERDAAYSDYNKMSSSVKGFQDKLREINYENLQIKSKFDDLEKSVSHYKGLYEEFMRKFNETATIRAKYNQLQAEYEKLKNKPNPTIANFSTLKAENDQLKAELERSNKMVDALLSLN